MKRWIAILLLALLTLSLAGCGGSAAQEAAAPEENTEPAEAPAEEPAEESVEEPAEEPVEEPAEEAVEPLPVGYAVDESGFCLTTGEFFEALQRVLNEMGQQATVMAGPLVEEMRTVRFEGLDKACAVLPSLAGQEAFPTDDEALTGLTVIADVSTEEPQAGMQSLMAALLYLTDPELADAQGAEDCARELLEAEHQQFTVGPLSFRYDVDIQRNATLAIRVTAAYQDD